MGRTKAEEKIFFPKTAKQLEKCTIQEVESYAKAAKKVIENRQRVARSKALNSIVVNVIKNQFSLEEIVVALRDKGAIFDKNYKNGQPQRLYQDPENELDIWCGAGRQPEWLRERLAMGANLEDFVMFKDIHEQNKQLDVANKLINRCAGKKSTATLDQLGEVSTANAGILFEMAKEDAAIVETKNKADLRKAKTASAKKDKNTADV